MKKIENKCPLCSRENGGVMQDHHLKPKMFKTRTRDVHDSNNKISIHKICHQKIHATFSEKDLFDYYHTIERLLESEQIQKFVKWISKKPLDFYDKSIETRSRKRKRKK